MKGRCLRTDVSGHIYKDNHSKISIINLYHKNPFGLHSLKDKYYQFLS